MWSQSFDKLMRNPAGRNVFREFLRTEYSEENMLFWLACEDLKQELNKGAIEEKARSIYEDYISILSPKEVTTLTLASASCDPYHTLPLPQVGRNGTSCQTCRCLHHCLNSTRSLNHVRMLGQRISTLLMLLKRFFNKGSFENIF